MAGPPSGADRSLEAVQELELTLLPRYAAFDGKEISDGQAFAGIVNDAFLRKDRAKLAVLFPSAQPLILNWSFDATNLTTGRSVPDLQVEISSTLADKDTVRVRFPEGDGIIEVRARAELTDGNGQAATAEHRFWSHQFRSGDATEAAAVVQALARAPIGRYDEVLQAYLRRTVRDERITIDELRKAIEFGLR